MKATLDAGGGSLRLDFDSAGARAAFVAEWRANAGCLVRLSEQLQLWAPLAVELRHEDAPPLTVAARVVQIFGGGEDGFATALEATAPADLEGLQPGATAAEPGATGSTGETAPATGEGEARGASPAFRIREMNVSEKMRLAPKATRGERQILLRDTSPQVLMGLLANPRIEEKEVLALAKSSSASSGVLQRIAKDRRWSSNYEIRLALVKNPLTPTPLALRMLDTLRERDLRVLAKGSTVREAIRGAALRKVIQQR